MVNLKMIEMRFQFTESRNSFYRIFVAHTEEVVKIILRL